jgi:hypothetical protein
VILGIGVDEALCRTPALLPACSPRANGAARLSLTHDARASVAFLVAEA